MFTLVGFSSKSLLAILQPNPRYPKPCYRLSNLNGDVTDKTVSVCYARVNATQGKTKVQPEASAFPTRACSIVSPPFVTRSVPVWIPIPYCRCVDSVLPPPLAFVVAWAPALFSCSLGLADESLRNDALRNLRLVEAACQGNRPAGDLGVSERRPRPQRRWSPVRVACPSAFFGWLDK